MKKLYIPFALFLVLVMFFSTCKNTEDEFNFPLNGTILSVSDFVGTWEGTSAIFSKAGAGPAVDVQIIEGGGYFVFEVLSNGGFNVTYTVPGSFPVLTYGRLGFDEDLLVMEFEEDPESIIYLNIVLDEPNLMISGGPIAESFDFDADGTFEDAYLDAVFERSP